MYNMSYDGVRSSPLSEINVGNVQNLLQLCRVKLGEGGTLHASPVVVGDTLYMTTAHSTVALDAHELQADLALRRSGHEGGRVGGESRRGVPRRPAVPGTPDGRLVALRSDSGRVLWNVMVGDPAVGEFLSSAPIA